MLYAFHVGMTELQAQRALYRLLEGFLLRLRGRCDCANLGQSESQLLVMQIQCPIHDLRQWHRGSVHQREGGP
jgi:hypothetical protein